LSKGFLSLYRGKERQGFDKLSLSGGLVRYELICHPDTPASSISGVTVFVWPIDGEVTERSFEFYVYGANTLALPAMRTSARADGLWKTTCFEAFLQRANATAYTEINLSPSFEWAAYSFDRYRDGMREASLAFDPEITISVRDCGNFCLDSDLDVSDFATGIVRMGLAAVIEEKDGTKSYWALAHAPGPPDFHNRDCFIATLPAPDIL
jgi:hypothetical protein